MASKIIPIDGGILEGGGQILRNAAALSCLHCQPIVVSNIRAGRSNPGLRPQHLCGLQLIKEICHGKLEGGQVGSEKITFMPGTIQAGVYKADTKTAGSTVLLIQAALPCLFFANGQSELHLKGGTNAEMAPQIDYLTWVFKPILESQGIRFECDIKKRGFFPKGGGEVWIQTQPIKYFLPIDMTDFGEIVKITGRAFVAGVLPIKISQQMAKATHDAIAKQYPGVPINIAAIKEQSHEAIGNGTGIIVMAETSTGCRLAGTALGRRGVPAETVGNAAAEMLLKNLSYGACVDEYLQDQLIILMALAKGRSQICCGPLTLHTRTAIHIAETLTQAKFDIKQQTKDSFIVECNGIGLANPHL